MKKLSIVAALALCTTIGGVYAAWVYHGSNASGYGIANLAITGVEYKGQAGTVLVKGSNTEIKIDDPTNGEAHVTKLTYNEQGEFTVTFSPVEDAKDSVLDGMDIQWYVGLSTGTAQIAVKDFKYEFDDIEYQIFDSIDSDPVVVTMASGKITKGGTESAPTYTFTIPMSEVVAKLTLEDNVLETEDEYNAYFNALKMCVLHVHAEVVPNT